MRRTSLALAVLLVSSNLARADILELLLGASTKPSNSGVSKTKGPSGSHDVVKTIDIKSEKGARLQTLTIGDNGKVYALCGPGREVSWGARGDKKHTAEVQVIDANGKIENKWTVEFLGQAINCAPDGTVLVAGDGKIATFDSAGKLLTEAELPHIASVLGDPDAIKKKAEEQRQQEIESYQETVKEFEKQAEEIKKKDEDKRTKTEKAQLKQAEQMVKSYTQMLERQKKQNIDDVVKQIASRAKMINAVAATEKDVYVVSGELKGYGFAIWRMDRNFQNPKQVMKNVRGCCGQMDIQAAGDDLWVAQNCDHKVGRYDRDGKLIKTMGKRGRDGDADCFGGCCNPMNVRIAKDHVYTAESEGHVRLFSVDGESKGFVGSVKISGGCKNVAIAVSPDGNTVYFCDQPGSKIHVMARKQEAASGTNQ